MPLGEHPLGNGLPTEEEWDGFAQNFQASPVVEGGRDYTPILLDGGDGQLRS